MSSMLEQAIIDAEQLKETARKTAEENIVEKYQDEIKQAVERILEQEEGSPVGALEVDQEGNVEMIEELPAAQITPDDETITLDLDKLEELMAEEELDPSDMLQREEVAEELEAITEDGEEVDIDIELNEDSIKELLDEDGEVEIDEDSIRAAIAEMLSEEDDLGIDQESEAKVLDAEAASAAATASKDTDVATLEEEEDLFETEDLEEKKDVDGDGDTDGADYRANQRMASGQSKEEAIKATRNLNKESKLLQKENKTLIREQKKMSNKVQLLEKRIDKYGTVIEQLKEKLDESNLTNAKLLYQNRILNSVSLNERQKEKIVETISNAKSVEEARIIFETLQSSVGTRKKRKMPESLNEVVSRSSSAFLPRKEEKTKSDPFADRMRALAGLK